MYALANCRGECLMLRDAATVEAKT